MVVLFVLKHVIDRIQLLFNKTALFVRIELLCSSFRRLPPNRANEVAVFEGTLLYRIWLPSNTATPVALFVLSCICQQTCVAMSTQIMTRWFQCCRGQRVAARLSGNY